ncbi:hypothetical protein BH10PSE15_BH10PSE15_13010 [soil metagenome]
MLFTSPLQLLVLCAVAVGAWLLGFATNPTSVNRNNAIRKLDRDFATFRAQAQSRLNTLTRHAATLEATHRTMTARLEEAEGRIAVFQAEAAPRVTPPPAPPVTATALDSAARPALVDDTNDTTAELPVPPLTRGESAAPPPDAEHVHGLASDSEPGTPEAAPMGASTPPEPTHGRLGGGARDRLTRIEGVDAALDMRLFELGITRFEDIEKLSDQDEMALELRLALPAGYIAGRQWRQQAAALRAGDLENFAGHCGAQAEA